MNEEITGYDMFDILFERAVKEDYENELRVIPDRKQLENAYSFSYSHTRRMKKAFSSDAFREIIYSIFSKARNFAAAAAAVIVIFSAVFFIFPEVRGAVSKVIIRWFDQYAEFVPDTDSDGIIISKWNPGYLPDGFSLVKQSKESEFILSEFSDSKGQTIFFSYTASDAYLAINNEGVVYSSKTINGIEYHIFESSDLNLNANLIIWEIKDCRFRISSEISAEELMAVAVSVTDSQQPAKKFP